MPRGSSQKRRPALEDLDERQRRIYDALPLEDLRQDFLAQLPDITIASASGKRKAKLILDRVHLLDRIVGDLQGHKQHLLQVAKELDQGGNPDGIDLRQELKPPSINGVVLRYVRGPRSKE